ncbi:oxygenase MpaB family protein [Sphingomonas montana]|uniref:oxygenase MpaB family protein n=1 Tax=Sphingomonas montana TaxID=1843236 RepID=UPI001F0AEDF7|nr:oxygenase MpaB family protein [Sphingomonas montana]
MMRAAGGARSVIRSRVQGLIGAGGPIAPRPPGDQGLFGPGSAAWAVHGDVTAMLIGGVSSLLLQMLHPGALAGVLDHSDFRRDMRGRLARTARFVALTTYGPTADAEAAIARVRGIHARVTGIVPGGGHYSANDPALLAWVHAAEVGSFLAAYLRYVDPAFPVWRQDDYHAEMAGLARRLGAEAVPETRAGSQAYMHAMRPALRVDVRTRDTARLLLAQPAPYPAAAPFQRLVLAAGIDLLPRWARTMHGLDVPVPARVAIRAAAAGAGGVVRWAMAG